MALSSCITELTLDLDILPTLDPARVGSHAILLRRRSLDFESHGVGVRVVDQDESLDRLRERTCRGEWISNRTWCLQCPAEPACDVRGKPSWLDGLISTDIFVVFRALVTSAVWLEVDDLTTSRV